ncbi:MAG: GC-type dockerin domain-anchored protein [Phycisphaerales bacterium JB060]
MPPSTTHLGRSLARLAMRALRGHVAILALALPALAPAQPCEPAWDGGPFGALGTPSQVGATLVWDDGAGPALYAGGEFFLAGMSQGGGVARWDGERWETLVGDDGRTLRGVGSLAVFDDGSGEQLYATGNFETIGGEHFGHIARWDGQRWRPVTGDNGTGVNIAAYDLAVWDDGSGPVLYVVGAFNRAGDIFADGIATWDGRSWSSVLGVRTPRQIIGNKLCLEVFDDGSGESLFVGGRMALGGSFEGHTVVRWDGTNWHTLGEGIPTNEVRDMAVYDDGRGPALYCTGFFATAGDETVNHVARWDGDGWEALGSGLDAGGDALGAFDDGTGPALYVGGRFESAGSVPATRLARWDGRDWSSPFPPGANFGISTIEAHDMDDGPRLFIGGRFWEIGGVARASLAAWDGVELASVGGGLVRGAEVTALSPALPGEGDGLYAGGSFVIEQDRALNHVGLWDGQSWQPLAGPDGVAGVSSRDGFARREMVNDIIYHDDGRGPAIFVSGSFSHAGDTPVGRIARWDGSQWSDLAGGVTSDTPVVQVNAMAIYDDGSGPALYAAGAFSQAGGVPASNIARWDGRGWSAVGTGEAQGLSGGAPIVYHLAVYDAGDGPQLYATGGFTRAGGPEGVTARGIARWDGRSWSSVGDAQIDSPAPMEVFDEGAGPVLFVGGRLFEPPLLTRLSRWDGRAWSAPGPQPTGRIDALATHQLGSRPVLVAAGDFELVGTVTANNIAAWDGAQWTAFEGPSATGVSVDAASLLSVDGNGGPSLWVGGRFNRAGGEPSWMLARYGCEQSCPADLDADGSLTIFDFLTFLDLFDAGDPIADFDGDGELTVFDFMAYQTTFDAGCG